MRRATGVAGLLVFAAATGLSACGSSATAQTTVPATAGVPLLRAATDICNAGLRLEASDQELPALGSAHQKVVGTTPRVGTVVARGTVVTLDTVSGTGGSSEVVVATKSCAPPSSGLFPTSPAQAADIAAVARSTQGAQLARQFPSALGMTTCTIAGGGPLPGLRVPGACATAVTPGPGGLATVEFLESWPAATFHGPGSPGQGQLSHSWLLVVSPAQRLSRSP